MNFSNKNKKTNKKKVIDLKNIFDWSLKDNYSNLESFKKELFFKKYNNHFKNRIKNYNYCRKITNEIFYTFYKQLNKYHNTKFSSHYWKFITYTWLFLKVNLFYDYWKLVEAINSKKKYINIYKVSDELLQFEEYKNISTQTDYYNFWLLSKIIKFKKIKYVEKEYKFENKKILKHNFGITKKIYQYILKFFLTFFHFKTFIYDLGIKKKYIFNLNIKLRQLPLFWVTPDYKHEEIDIKKRKSFFYINKNKKNFKSFFNSVMYNIIPKSYLENFENINLSLKSFWPKNINLILAQSIRKDDIFKIWAANMKQKNSKVFLFQHGGFYGMSKFHDGEELESDLSSKFFTWGWKSNNKKISSFIPLKFNTTKISQNVSEEKKDKIIFCISIHTKYLSPIPGFYPRNNFERITKLLSVKEVLSGFKPSIRAKTTIRYNGKIFLRNSYSFNKSFFGNNISFDNGSKQLVNHLNKSRLVIHDNNSTGWLETIFYDIPTVIILNKDIEKFRNKFSKNLNELKKNKIIHFNSSSLTKFVNNNYSNIEKWWNSEKVKKSVKSFKDEYMKSSSDPLNDLIKVLK